MMIQLSWPQQLAEALHAISRCLQAMGKINKLSTWVQHHLNECQAENNKVICDILLQYQERKSFLH